MGVKLSCSCDAERKALNTCCMLAANHSRIILTICEFFSQALGLLWIAYRYGNYNKVVLIYFKMLTGGFLRQTLSVSSVINAPHAARRTCTSSDLCCGDVEITSSWPSHSSGWRDGTLKKVWVKMIATRICKLVTAQSWGAHYDRYVCHNVVHASTFLHDPPRGQCNIVFRQYLTKLPSVF